jgi:hypothetical protein
MTDARTKTRDELLADLRCELRGLLLESFCQARQQGEFTKDGRVMVQQMNRANNLFDRIVQAATNEPPPAKVDNRR